MNILTLENVEKSFGAVKAVRSGHLELRRGEVHALMGENGAGKSTLMNILSGAMKPDSGTLCVYGKEVVLHSPIDAIKLGIGKIHQELQLVPELSIAGNVFLGREPLSMLGTVNYKKMYSDAQDIIAALNLHVSAKTPVKSLRMGEKQLVEIAKVLSLHSKIVIMDEPTSALSKAETERLFEVIEKLKKEDISFIYITHRMEEVFEITDRVTVMRDGEYIKTLTTSQTNKDELVRLMVGREVGHIEHSPAQIGRDEMLRVENLSANFPAFSKKTSLKNISLSVKKGEVLGIAGLMGAGRTEFLECIFGLHHKYRTGNIFIDGEKVVIDKPQDGIKKKIAFLTEDRKGQGLVLGRSIGENMSLPIITLLSPRWIMNRGAERKLWARQMRDIDIKAPSYNTHASDLSGGNQQKVIIARWLLTEPELLLLDEPTRGIDVGARGEIYKLIAALANGGKAILVVSSELPELLSICDRIVTFCDGRLTGEFACSEANQELLLHAATISEEEQNAKAGSF